MWKGRKAAFAAMGRVSPDYYVQDGVIPRTKLPEVLREIRRARGRVRPAGRQRVPRRRRQPAPAGAVRRAEEGASERALEVATSILELCIAQGGSITGEHGVGDDKACSMPKMFTGADLTVMDRLRSAFDPERLSNPGKLLPTPRLCGEVPGFHRVHPVEAAGLGERF